MCPEERHLLAVAQRALADGWHSWELAEVVLAEARKLGMLVPATALDRITRAATARPPCLPVLPLRQDRA